MFEKDKKDIDNLENVLYNRIKEQEKHKK